MKYLLRGSCLAFIALLLLPSALVQAANSISQLVPFQGRLHNSSGNVVSDGVYDLSFYIYDTPTGGEFVWSENHTQVSVIHGYVNVLLGATEGASFSENSVDFSTQKYLSISIEGGQEMFPRHQLVPTFHAFNATKLGGEDASTYAQVTYVDNEITTVTSAVNNITTNISAIVSARFVEGGNVASEAVDSQTLDDMDSSEFLHATQTQDFVPVGAIVTWPTETLPSSGAYVECNGAYLEPSAYPELFAVLAYKYGSSGTKFKLPDYRGMFLRGWDHYAGNDPDSYSRKVSATNATSFDGVGSYQSGETKAHNHGYTGAVGTGHPDGSGDNTTAGSTNSYPTLTQLKDVGGSETRPTNLSVMYIIKASSITPTP